jgi:hypothetical protein
MLVVAVLVSLFCVSLVQAGPEGVPDGETLKNFAHHDTVNIRLFQTNGTHPICTERLAQPPGMTAAKHPVLGSSGLGESMRPVCV